MEQKLLKIKDEDSCYTFRYYRYKVAEYLHKFFNEENAMTIGDNSETKSNSRRIAI